MVRRGSCYADVRRGSRCGLQAAFPRLVLHRDKSGSTDFRPRVRDNAAQARLSLCSQEGESTSWPRDGDRARDGDRDNAAVIAAVVLAAGEARRFGSPKQRLMLGAVLAAVRASAVDEIVVVAGAYELETDARVVRCAEWARGAGASLRCGLSVLPPETEAAVVVLADGPELAPAAIDRLVAAWHERGSEVLAAGYGGARGHPVLLARSAWGRVPDEGARALEPELVPSDDLGQPGDVDYPDDLPERFRGESGAPPASP